MQDAAQLRFDTITDFHSLEALIEEGTAEDLFFECKAPSQPKVNKDVKVKLAEALSGFSNTEGGIMFYGIETSKLDHADSDIMIDIPRVGAIRNFSMRLINTIPTLTMPAVTNFQTKIVKRKQNDSAGVLVLYIPKKDRPVQSLMDGRFHFRGGDQFVEAPYSVVERLFTSTSTPSLRPSLTNYEFIDNGITRKHTLQLLLENDALAVGKEIDLWMEVKDNHTLQSFNAGSMLDASESNGGRRVYTKKVNEVIHHQLGTILETLSFEMKPRKRKVEVLISVYAENMARKRQRITIEFNKSSLSSIEHELKGQ